MNFFRNPTPQRMLVIDSESRSLKILLAARQPDGVRVLQHRAIELPESGLSETEELNKLVEGLLQEFENVPVAIRLPQQLSISQIINLPRVGPEEIEGLIKEETVKFSGLSEGGIVYDYGKLEPFGANSNPYWVTFGKEEEILGEASRLAGVGERLCEIITPANAMIATYQSLPSAAKHALLVELGVTSTVVAIVAQGQPAYAMNFPIGSESFAETNSPPKNPDVAETRPGIKYVRYTPAEAPKAANSRPAVDEWRFELEKILRDWLRENPDLNVPVTSFRVVLGGAIVREEALIPYLRSTSHLHFEDWPALPVAGNELPMGIYAVAYGAALKSLGVSLPSTSLFPADLRVARKRRSAQALFQRVNWIVLGCAALLLLLGTVQKLSLISKKKQLLHRSETVLQEAKVVESLYRQWDEAYERLRPLLNQQKQTLVTLTTLSRLQQGRADKKVWYVLYADQASYFAGATAGAAPALPTGTNAEVVVPIGPNIPGKYGFIAGLALEEEGEAMRQTLSQVVEDLKKDPAFDNVDILPAGQRKNLANTNVMLPDRNFALSIELAENIFQKPLPVLPPLDPPEIKTNSRVIRPTTGRPAGSAMPDKK